MIAPSSPGREPETADPVEAPDVASSARRFALLNIGLLGGLALALTAYLWPQWRHNPDLSHGLFMPLVCALLLWESKRRGVPRYPRPGAMTLTAISVLAVLALACLATAGLFAVSLGWSLSLVGFMFSAAFATALLAGFVAFSAEPLRIIPLNWTTISVAALWLLAAPMPPGTYSMLTLRLQMWVTGSVMAALNILGVAARQHGNLIELANSTVGVEEACSGIRSLLSCVYAGFFFSALLVRRPWARALLLAVAAPLAIVMNFVRSLALTLMANAGVDITGFWHDATGFAVLGITAAALAGLALLLESGRPGAARSPPTPAKRLGSRPALLAGQVVLTGTLLLGASLTVFFVLHTRPASQAARPVPDLAAILPAAPAGWTVVTSTDLFRFTDTLQTDHLFQRTYYRGPADRVTQVTVYLAYWPPGQASVSTVALHTPDACWPGAGWQPVASPATRFAPVLAGRTLPAAESRLFASSELTQYVWFWHLYDGVSITQRDPRSPRELLAIAWHYGFRRNGEQLFVRISSNQPWNAIAGEPLLAEIFDHLHAFGL
jgi:exosortase